MNKQELEQWAASHQTDIRIAEVIEAMAEDMDVDMERIWQEPVAGEVWAVCERISEEEHDGAYWGIDSLSSIKRTFGLG